MTLKEQVIKSNNYWNDVQSHIKDGTEGINEEMLKNQIRELSNILFKIK